MEWNENLSVGVPSIDQQHKKLIDMVNDLGNAMRTGKGKEAIGQTINDMLGYTRTHFATEERHFDAYGYPDGAAHKKEHADFIKKVSEFKEDSQGGSVTVSIEVLEFLTKWLTTHIMGTDKKYSAFLTEKGVR